LRAYRHTSFTGFDALDLDNEDIPRPEAGGGPRPGPCELPATGNRVDFTALQLFRIEDELIAEHWEIFDETTLTQQLSG